MLGSRFDLSRMVNEIAMSRGDEGASGLDGRPRTRDASDVKEHLDRECVLIEEQMAAVARHLHFVHPAVTIACPVCEERMQVRRERALSEFGSLDVKVHELECTACGMMTGRVFHPSVGYHTLVR